jgi:hypothetical protein
VEPEDEGDEEGDEAEGEGEASRMRLGLRSPRARRMSAPATGRAVRD